ncbi:MAG TPA: hypothetical protein VKG79_11855 [Bryobacteraceae bacterium]|nr:hypothetical protein [Bryobacteraceae bacterium]
MGSYPLQRGNAPFQLDRLDRPALAFEHSGERNGFLGCKLAGL